MKCIEREKLFELARHLIEAWEEERVLAHVAGCPACRAVVEEYQRVDAALDEWKAAGPSRWFDQRVRAAVAVEKQGFLSLGRIRALALATLAMIAIVSAVVVVHLRSSRSEATAVARRELPAAAVPQPPAVAQSISKVRVTSGADEVKMYENLSVLEDYDMLTNFDVLSELQQPEKKVDN